MLAALAIVGGLIDIPRGWAHLQKLEEFVAPVLPAAPLRHGGLAGALWTTFVPGVVALAGIGLAWLLYERRRQEAPEAQTSAAARYFLGGWGFDRLYRYAFARRLADPERHPERARALVSVRHRPRRRGRRSAGGAAMNAVSL